MRIKKSKEVVSIKDITVGFKCDCCGLIIDIDSFSNKWHSFSSHHNEWGNDSFESHKDYDVCSPRCYFIMIDKIIENGYAGEYDGKIDYMEIQFATLLNEYLRNEGK